jgi:integrase
MNIEPRNGIWYAVVVIPKDLREEFGKMKFIKSLQTSSKQVAQHRALPLISKWKAAIRQARGETDAIIKEATLWRRDLSAQNDVDAQEAVELALSERVEEIATKSGNEKANEFYMVASGKATLLKPLYEEWKEQLDLAPKTIDQMGRDLLVLVQHFSILEKIAPRTVKTWIDGLISKGQTYASLERLLKACRNFWKYLRKTGVVELDAVDPFQGMLSLVSDKVAKNKQGRVAFSPKDVARIYQAALDGGDQPLADLIALGAYTGARINELASLKVEDVTESQSLLVRDAKTKAGIREIPIHPAIQGLVERLKRHAQDGYLIPGSGENKYGNRGDHLSKRFGRLKATLGYTKGSEVFHSIRKTLITLLENAGVPEGIAADIVGHQKQTMTYGLYSMGTSLENKREVIARASYPSPLDAPK